MSRSLPILTLLALCCVAHTALAQNVEEYGPLKLGRALPKKANIDAAPKGRFYIHFIHRNLPVNCLDEVCGAEGEKIADMGGHLLGGSDESLAAIFHVRTSLAVLSDSKGIVMQIIPGAARSDLESLAHTGQDLAKTLEAAEKSKEDCGKCKIPSWARSR